MSIHTVYELYYSWYEDYVPQFFFAPSYYLNDLPSEKEWSLICNSLLDEAVSTLIKMPRTFNDGTTVDRGSIGWHDIVEQVGALLEAKGWKRIQPVKKGYWGSCVIKDGDNDVKDDEDYKGRLSDKTFAKVLAHNKAEEEKSRQYWEEWEREQEEQNKKEAQENGQPSNTQE